MTGITFPILRGPLAGKKWLLASRSNFFWGTYEPEQTQAFQKIIRPGDVVFDVGAHYGYYTLLSSALAGPKGKVFAFEPSPGNIPRLKKHLDINHCDNVQVIELALSDHEGSARFDNHAGSGTGHLSPDGQIEVQITSLDAISARLPAPCPQNRLRRSRSRSSKGGENTIYPLSQPFSLDHGDGPEKDLFRPPRKLGICPHLPARG
jgi:FkbM family methyltransferase